MRIFQNNKIKFVDVFSFLFFFFRSHRKRIFVLGIDGGVSQVVYTMYCKLKCIHLRKMKQSHRYATLYIVSLL